MMRSTLVSMALAAGLVACGDVSIAPPDSDPVPQPDGGTSCAAPLVDCDHDGTCETTLDSVENCGACGVVCSSSHAAATCAAGACALACDAGYSDCNGLASDGCESQLALDPSNCGACGVSCGAWGDCFHSTCVEILASAAALAVGADALVIEGPDLYWSSGGVEADGVIARVPLSGGATTTLATEQHYADCLRSNGSSLVWSSWGDLGVYGMPITGGPVQTLWQPSGSERPHVLEIDAARVYFTTGSDVQAIPVGGGAATVLASGFTAVAGAHLAGGSLYLTDLGPTIDQTTNGTTVPGHPEGTIARVSLASGAVEILAQHLDTPVAVTTTGDALFWAEAGSMATYFVDGGDQNFGTLGRIGRAGLDGSSPSVVADKLVQPVDLAADSTHLYWAVAGTVGGVDPAQIAYVSDGSLMRAPLAGGQIETVMPAIDARKVVLSSDAVFFSSWIYGIILKKTKP